MKIFIRSAESKLLSHKNIFVFQCDCRVTNEAANTALQFFRSDITVVCKAMEFGQFPLDKHKCYFILTSCKLLLTSGPGWGIQTSASKSSIRRFVITEKAPTKVFHI